MAVRWLTRFQQQPLAQQLSWALLSVCASALLLAGLALTSLVARNTHQVLAEELRSVAGLVANRSSAALAFGDEATARENLSALSYLPYVGQACLQDAQGRTLAEFARDGQAAQCPARRAISQDESQADTLSKFAMVRAGDQVVGVLWLRATPGVVMQRLAPTLWAGALAMALAMGAALLVAVPLKRVIGAPMNTIRDVANRVIDSGDYSLRVPDLGRNELGRLAAAFNRMLETIGAQNTSLAGREHYARALFAGSHQAQLVIDRATGRVRDANLASARLLGQAAPRDLVNQPFASLLPSDHRWDEGFWEQLQPEATEDLELPMRREALGHAWDCHAHFLRLTLFGHDLVHCSLEDVTQRNTDQRALLQTNEELEQRVAERTDDLGTTIDRLNQAREQLVEVEKQSALGRLVAGMAHEINTPVGNAQLAVSSMAAAHAEFSALIEKGLRRSDLNRLLAHVGEGTQLAQRNLQRVIDLVSTFKQISADQASSESRRFDVAELVADVLQVMSPQLRRTPFELVTDIAPGLVMHSHAGPLEQVLVNLINNAMLHGFDGRTTGTITVTAHAHDHSAHRVLITVQDDGRGINAQHLPRIFDPFFTTKLGRGGIGLGLAIVHNLVTQLLGGTLVVQSQPGHGTRFVMDLPCQAHVNSSTEHVTQPAPLGP